MANGKKMNVYSFSVPDTLVPVVERIKSTIGLSAWVQSRLECDSVDVEPLVAVASAIDLLGLVSDPNAREKLHEALNQGGKDA